MSGRIVLAATPIGNRDDASERLRQLLAQAQVIAAEDTRTVRHLAQVLGVEITGTVLALHDHNESAAATQAVAAAERGDTVLVVSDAGMPTVADPGFRVVEAAIAAGVDVTVAPGPSAALAALAVSGLPTDRFAFEGFLPRKAAARRAAAAAVAHEPRTMVFFEAPHRLAAALEDLAQALGGERRAAVSRELTKMYEETRRGTLAELATWATEHSPKGEMVITVAGAGQQQVSMDAVVDDALTQIAGGASTSAVVAELARTAGVSKRELYALVLARRTRPGHAPPHTH